MEERLKIHGKLVTDGEILKNFINKLIAQSEMRWVYLLEGPKFETP
jgi:hypothetical protein